MLARAVRPVTPKLNSWAIVHRKSQGEERVSLDKEVRDLHHFSCIDFEVISTGKDAEDELS